MTVLEFESWVSDNYEKLVRVSQHSTRGSEKAMDLLHESVEGFLADPRRIPEGSPSDEKLLSLFGIDIKRNGLDGLEHDAQQAGLKQRFASSLAALGTEDTFIDPYKRRRSLENRREYLKKKKLQSAKPDIQMVPAGAWEGPMPGKARWRFQTLRDNRLFDLRAASSLAESMRRASQRQRHFGEQGLSHTEWGTETLGTQEAQETWHGQGWAGSSRGLHRAWQTDFEASL